MSKYFYNGSDITNLIITGSTKVSGYTDFPSYKPASNYSTERPIPFNYYTPEGEVSKVMDASFVEFDSGSGTYTLSPDFDSVRIILIGGAGGAGGGGGCGWSSPSSVATPSIARSSGQGGFDSEKGSFTFTSNYIKLSSQNIYYSVGTEGASGNSGGDKAKTSVGPGGRGNAGNRGNESMVTINVDGIDYNIYANGGYGGAGGDAGGPGSAQGEPRQPGPAFTNNYPGIVDYTPSAPLLSLSMGSVPIVPSSVNPLNYLFSTLTGSNVVGAGYAGGGGDASTANQSSSPGYRNYPGKIRIYLLKS
jgi:hypothetical protein